LLNAFLDGYQQLRPLSRTGHEAIPHFELVSIIWVMTSHADNANRIGYKLLEKPFWQRRLVVLRELDTHQ
jgi:Ser/Thr protein kinase RdoA (MazF antagonist)